MEILLKCKQLKLAMKICLDKAIIVPQVDGSLLMSEMLHHQLHNIHRDTSFISIYPVYCVLNLPLN